MTFVLDRRPLLRAGFGAALLPGLRRLAFAAAPAAATAPLLVLVNLRGGMDALNFLSPVDDPQLNAARPAQLIAGQGHRLDIPGTSNFRLHAEAAALAEIWRDGRLAIWPAAGMPMATR